MKVASLLLCLFFLGSSLGNLTAGNLEWTNAINAALAQIFVNREWVTISAPYNVGLRTQDCVASTNYFPFPSRTAGGTLDEILTSGVWKIALSYSHVPISFFNDTSNQVEGFEPALWRRASEIIAAHYGVSSITIQWVNSDPFAQFLDIVYNGTADNFAGAIIPGQYNVSSKMTTTQVGNMACSYLTESGSALVSGALGTPSWAALNQASVKVGRLNAGTTLGTIVSAKAPLAVQSTYAGYDELFDALEAGTIDVALAYGPTVEYYLDNLSGSFNKFDLGISFMRSIVGRRDAAQPAAPSRDTAVDGNQQLEQAFQASLADMYTGGYWDQLYAKYSLLTKVQDCVPQGSSWYPYPSSTGVLDGALKTVLATKNITFCFNNAYPYIVQNSTGAFGLYPDIASKFVSDLETQYGVTGIQVNYQFSARNPVFQDVYDNNCQAYIGTVTPGNLGLVGSAYTTTAQRLYQSCAINVDAVSIVAGPGYTGTLTLDAINALPNTTVIGSVNNSASARNYVMSFVPGKDYTTQYDTYAPMWAALQASQVGLVVNQFVSTNNWIQSLPTVEQANYRILTLYDQILYSVSFYKPDPNAPTSTSGSVAATTTSVSSTSSVAATTSAPSNGTTTTSSASSLAFSSLLLAAAAIAVFLF